MTPQARARLTALLALLFVMGIVATFRGRSPESIAWLPRCPSRQVFNIACPGCGSTRCIHRLVTGRIADALRLNALAVVALPFLIWSGIAHLARVVFGRRLPTIRTPWWWPRFILVVVLFWFVVRNLPFWPTSLRP